MVVLLSFGKKGKSSFFSIEFDQGLLMGIAIFFFQDVGFWGFQGCSEEEGPLFAPPPQISQRSEISIFYRLRDDYNF